MRLQAIRPDEEADLPVDLPEDKSGKAKAKEDNEEDAGQHTLLSLKSLCKNMPCYMQHLLCGLWVRQNATSKPDHTKSQQELEGRM